MIRVEDLTVTLGDTSVLEDVSMAVDDGEFVGLVGPNGAGKTTILRCLSGILTPDSGIVTVDGDAIDQLGSRASSRRIAVVPQDTTLGFDFSVRDVVAMGRTPHRGRFERATKDDRTIVENAMARTAVDDLADKSIRAVSGGERQRVVLARALAQEAPVLLLDEPTASLDVNHQIRTLDLVADLVADGRTAVAAIHDLSLAARYCDRLVLIADGGVVAAGPPDRVLNRDTVAASFDADAAVTHDPVTATRSVTPLSNPGWSTNARIHVLGSGPDAARAVTVLAAAGATVTAGPVQTGDAVATVADGVDADCTTVPPFDGLDPDTISAVRERTTDASVVVLAGHVPTQVLGALDDDTKLLGTDDADFVPTEPRLAETDLPRVDVETAGGPADSATTNDSPAADDTGESPDDAGDAVDGGDDDDVIDRLQTARLGDLLDSDAGLELDPTAAISDWDPVQTGSEDD